MSRANTTVCNRCARPLTPQEPRVVVRYQRTTYDTGGRVLERLCLTCRPAEAPRDQRHTREAATR